MKNRSRFAYTENGHFTHVSFDGVKTMCGKIVTASEVKPKSRTADGIDRPSHCMGACKRG